MSEPPVPSAVRARVLVPFAVVTLVWGSTWLVIRHQLGTVPSEWSITYRFTVATVALFAIAAATRGPLMLPRRGQPLAAAIGLLHFVLNFQFVYRAEAHIASGLVAVVFALLVVPNALLGRIFLGQKLSRPFLAGSGIALVGIALLFAHELGRDGASRADTVTGVATTFAAVLAASVANVLQATERSRTLPAVTLLAWATLYGAAIDAAWAAIVAGAPRFDPSAVYVGGVLYLGLLGSALSFPLYLGVIRAIGPARAAYSSVLIPVLAMALSTLFEGYRWSPTAAAGAVLTLAGLVWALRARSSRA